MKVKVLLGYLLVNAALVSSVAPLKAQDRITIRSARFATPLVEKWIAEYTKANPSTPNISIADDKDKAADIQISVNDGQGGSYEKSVARYAILPIASKQSSLVEELRKKRLNVKRLKELYFEKDVDDEDYDPDAKERYTATVYACANQQSVTGVFARHFGYEPTALKGKKIAGDDIYVNHALAKDASGVSFNNLNYVFDLASRRLKDEIALLPLDLKREYSEILVEANLDRTIELLETKRFDIIPVEELTFVVSSGEVSEINNFIEWIRTEGQAFNHEYGFLRLEDRRLAKQ
jgi:ABC-type phosphate transport system substrate-binding protein